MRRTPLSLRLIHAPTPVHLLPRLSEHVGSEIWVKRDDLTGLGLSGNKIRKLEFLIAEANALGADTLITTGGLQSNHCRATAVAARRLGLRPILLLRGELPPVPNGNVLLDRLLGAELHTCTADEYHLRRTELMDAIADNVRGSGGQPYVIPEGGSNGLGAMGYIRAAGELGGQTVPAFDQVAVAVGSGGTVAGLAMARPAAQVVGYAVCDDRQTFVERVQDIAREALDFGAPPLTEPGTHWDIEDAYKGEAYAVAGPEVWQTIATVARLEGLFLDPVYTGKAMHGLIEDLRSGRRRGRSLFWHTGGAFGLFGRGNELPPEYPSA